MQQCPLIVSRPLGGYGLWEATARLSDGQEFTGGGWSREQAEYRALLLAARAQALAPYGQEALR